MTTLTMKSDFADALRSLDVENVLIYVGDAVRWDFLPEEIDKIGTTIKTVSASIHSPTSFATLVTGVYPSSHGVYSFNHRLSSDQPRLFDLKNYRTAFINSIRCKGTDPIFTVLDAPTEKLSDPFKGSTPFIVMERGQGGHAPYQLEFETAGDYFRARNSEGDKKLRQEYRAAVENDSNLFINRVSELEEQGLLDDTLVIYTSDHGELLGEGGLFGHTCPMRPELIYVPTVFVHKELPTNKLTNPVFRHIDLLPTVVDVLDIQSFSLSVFKGEPATTGLSNEPAISRYRKHFISDEVPILSGKLSYAGVWDSNGGYVFPHSKMLERLSVLVGKLFKSDKRGLVRRRIYSAAGSYLAGKTKYGNPAFTIKEAEKLIDRICSRSETSVQMDLSETDKQHLRDLGYL